MKSIEERDVYVLNEFLKRLLDKGVLHQRELDTICKSGESNYYYEDEYWGSLYHVLIESGAASQSVQLGFVKPNENTATYYNTNYFASLADKQRNNDSKSKLEMEKLILEVDKLNSEKWRSKWGFRISIIAIILSLITLILKVLPLLQK